MSTTYIYNALLNFGFSYKDDGIYQVIFTYIQCRCDFCHHYHIIQQRVNFWFKDNIYICNNFVPCSSCIRSCREDIEAYTEQEWIKIINGGGADYYWDENLTFINPFLSFVIFYDDMDIKLKDPYLLTKIRLLLSEDKSTREMIYYPWLKNYSKTWCRMIPMFINFYSFEDITYLVYHYNEYDKYRKELREKCKIK